MTKDANLLLEHIFCEIWERNTLPSQTTWECVLIAPPFPGVPSSLLCPGKGCFWISTGIMLVDLFNHKRWILALLSLPSRFFSHKGKFPTWRSRLFFKNSIVSTGAGFAFDYLGQKKPSKAPNPTQRTLSLSVMKQTFCKLVYKAGSQYSVAVLWQDYYSQLAQCEKKQFSFLSHKEWRA